jgi:hypothetical protein
MMPLALTAVHEFRPDFAVGLFTALFALTIVWLGCHAQDRDKELRTHGFVGLIIGMAYLAKPSFVPHTTVMWVAAFCLAEICYRIFSADRRQVVPTLNRLLGQIAGTVLLAGPYFLVNWRHVLDYLLTNTGGGSDAFIWKVPGGIWGSFRTYLAGGNMVHILGFFAPALLLWVLVGITASWVRKRPRSSVFIICGGMLSGLSAFIIAVGQMDNPFFGLTWHITFLLTAIFAIGEACPSQRISVLAIGVTALSLVIFCLRPPWTNIWHLSEDARVENSLNYIVLKRIADASSTDSKAAEKPAVFVTFFGDVNSGSQQWLSLKHHIRLDFSDMHRSGSLTEQMKNVEGADFVEVADPKSKWLFQWLPSAALQEPILGQLRAKPYFQELPSIIGREGTLYLFQRKSSGFAPAH